MKINFLRTWPICWQKSLFEVPFVRSNSLRKIFFLNTQMYLSLPCLEFKPGPTSWRLVAYSNHWTTTARQKISADMKFSSFVTCTNFSVDADAKKLTAFVDFLWWILQQIMEDERTIFYLALHKGPTSNWEIWVRGSITATIYIFVYVSRLSYML